MLHRLLTLCLLLAALPLVGCAHGQATVADDADAISFSEDIQPLLAEKFAPLLTEDEELRVDTWEHLIAGSEHGAVVIPFDAGRSVLVQVCEQAAAAGRPGAPTEDEIALVRRWIEQGARNGAGEVPYAGADQLLYATSEGSALISVIDMENNLVIRTVDLTELGFSEHAKPHDVAVEPDGSHWYVSLIGANRVLKFNRDNELVGQVEIEVPGMLALDSASDRLFVGRSMSAVDPPSSIVAINREDMTVMAEIGTFFPRPHALATKPGGSSVYVGSMAQDRIATIDPKTKDVELISLRGPHHMLVQFDIAPDGATMVGGGQMSGQFFIFDVTSPLPVVEDTLAVGGQPWHPVYTPDGSRIYVGSKGTGVVTVIDAETRTIEAVIEHEAIAEPHGSAVRPDGRYVYISNSNTQGAYTPRYDLPDNAEAGTVVVIDTRTNEVVKVLEIGENPAGMGAVS